MAPITISSGKVHINQPRFNEPDEDGGSFELVLPMMGATDGDGLDGVLNGCTDASGATATTGAGAGVVDGVAAPP